jgi:hypothetical protein
MNNEERRRRAIAHFAQEAERVNAKLSEEQKMAIVGLAPGLMKKRVPENILKELAQLNLIERKLGGPALTILGKFVARLNGAHT